MERESVGRELLDAAFKVHSALGPGLLESAYEACLEYELSNRNVLVRRQVVQPVSYQGITIDSGYRLDLLLEDQVVVEIKSIKAIESVHEAQLLSYLKLGGYQLGYLLNFNVRRMKDGIKRMVNNLRP